MLKFVRLSENCYEELVAAIGVDRADNGLCKILGPPAFDERDLSAGGFARIARQMSGVVEVKLVGRCIMALIIGIFILIVIITFQHRKPSST